MHSVNDDCRRKFFEISFLFVCFSSEDDWKFYTYIHTHARAHTHKHTDMLIRFRTTHARGESLGGAGGCEGATDCHVMNTDPPGTYSAQVNAHVAGPTRTSPIVIIRYSYAIAGARWLDFRKRVSNETTRGHVIVNT